MDVIGVIFINLFLLPVISLKIMYTRKGEPPKSNMLFWMHYCCWTVVLVPVTKIAATLLEKTAGVSAEMYSGYYTLAGIVCAAILPYIAVILQKTFNIKCTIERDGEENEEK